MFFGGIFFVAYSAEGKSTALALLNRDAYKLKLEEPKEDKVGSGIVLSAPKKTKAEISQPYIPLQEWGKP